MQTVYPLARKAPHSMTTDDLTQPLCEFCSKPISDDRLGTSGKATRYCSKQCGKAAWSRRRRNTKKPYKPNGW